MSKPNVTRVQSGTERTASVLLRSAVVQSATPLLLLYYSVLQSLTPVLLQYYSVLQSTTPLLLRTTKYYSVLQSATPLLPQYYSVPQSTTLALHYKPKQSTSQPVWPAGRRTRCWPANTGSLPAGRGRNSEQVHGAVFLLERTSKRSA